MKKKLFALVFVVSTGAYTAYQLKEKDINDVTLANIEALASYEWGGTGCFVNSTYSSCATWNFYSHCYCGIW